MTYERDERVDTYIDGLPDWQQDICRTVRDLVHATDPEVEETIKRTVQPYFVLQGNICALLATKDHVNIFLSTTAASFPIQTGSSRQVTTTRPHARSPTGRGTKSRPVHSARCSHRSLRTTAPVAGES